MRRIFILGILAIVVSTAPANAQQTVNGGMVVLGPLRSNGSTSAVDFTASAATAPVKTGALAARPGACVVGQMYFSTDAAAGQNLAYCTAPGVWSVSSGGSGGGGGAGCQLASTLGFALDGTDETTLLNSTLATLAGAGGGCLAIDGGKKLRADGQVLGTGTEWQGFRGSIRITGGGALGGDGVWSPGTSDATSSVLDLRYAGGSKILAVYFGTLEIDHVTVTTLAGNSDCAEFLRATNTTLYIHNTTFWGGKAVTNSCNDALVLGGNGAGGTDYTVNGVFNGYGSVVRDNRFLNMARVAVLNSASNGTVFDSNYVQGGNSTAAVSTVFDLRGYARANQFTNNLIELGNGAPQANQHLYTCAFKLFNAQGNTFRGNQIWDGDNNTYAFCGGSTSATQNLVDKSNFVDIMGTRLTDTSWPANNYMPYRTIPFFFDGGGAALSGTTTRCGLVSFAGQMNQFTMAADQVGTARITVKAVTLGAYTGPGSASDISNGGELMSGAIVKQDTDLAYWNKTLVPNTMVCFTLSNPSGITWVGGSLQVWEGR